MSETSRPAARWLLPYGVSCYALGLLNTMPFLQDMVWAGPGSALFNLCLLATYALFYLLPALALTLLGYGALRLLVRRAPPALGRAGGWALLGLAWIGPSCTQTLVYADRRLHDIFGVHFNGFVWNLVTTPGGIESMGSSTGAEATYAAAVAAWFLAHAALLLLATRWGRYQDVVHTLGSRRRLALVAAMLFAASLGERVAYGVCRLRGEPTLPLSAQALPLYQPMTFRSLGLRLGLQVDEDEGVRIHGARGRVRYPLHPLVVEPPARPLNVVWLVAESLRADALDPEVMPQAWAFAQRARRFTNHYSGGNGTRMGIFSQFYGLYGAYWFAFLDERRGPALMDLVLAQGYQLSIRTSANFSYPEFDRTVFSRVPPEDLHGGVQGLQKWEADRHHVQAQLEFLRRRDPSRPFFLFQFFESPHAQYWFPPESIIRQPYLEEFNYATVDLHREIELIRNRYLNSCHHLDSQLALVFDELSAQGLLDSTVVILTGDHGEEFMEHGRWGHNSEFHEEQLRVPFVLWLPGVAPGETTRLTSHLDVPATLLPLLGVRNDPADYSLGTSLLAATGRDHTIVCDWRRVGYLDERYKAALPLATRGLFEQHVTTREDAPLDDPSEFFRQRKHALARLLEELGRFQQ